MIVQRKFIYENSDGDRIILGLESDFIIKTIEGISENNVELSASRSIGQVGETITGKNVQRRSITINGIINGNVEVNRHRLLNIIRPKDNAKLICELNNYESYYLNITPNMTPIVSNTDCVADFQFVVNSEYPYWRNTLGSSEQLIGIVPRFRFERNFSGTWRVGETVVSELINVYNPGSETIGVEFLLRAKTACKNITIVNAETYEYFKINYSMQPFEVIRLTTGFNNKKIISSLNGNIIKDVDLLNSTFLQLRPGDNVFKVIVEENEEGLDVEAIYEITKVGV